MRKKIKIIALGGEQLKPYVIGTVISVDGLGVIHALLEDGTIVGIVQDYDEFKLLQEEKI